MPDADRPTWQELLTRAQSRAGRPGWRAPVTHIQGMPWDLLPTPWRWHRCWAQSWGSIGPFRLVQRCPCGATRLDEDGPWLGRNLLRPRLRTRRALRRGLRRSPGGEDVGDTTPLLLELRDALRDRGENHGG